MKLANELVTEHRGLLVSKCGAKEVMFAAVLAYAFECVVELEGETSHHDFFYIADDYFDLSELVGELLSDEEGEGLDSETAEALARFCENGFDYKPKAAVFRDNFELHFHNCSQMLYE